MKHLHRASAIYGKSTAWSHLWINESVCVSVCGCGCWKGCTGQPDTRFPVCVELKSKTSPAHAKQLLRPRNTSALAARKVKQVPEHRKA